MGTAAACVKVRFAGLGASLSGRALAYRGLGGAHPVASEAHRVGQAGHQVPDAPVHAGGVDAQQYFLLADRGPGDLL